MAMAMSPRWRDVDEELLARRRLTGDNLPTTIWHGESWDLLPRLARISWCTRGTWGAHGAPRPKPTFLPCLLLPLGPKQLTVKHASAGDSHRDDEERLSLLGPHLLSTSTPSTS